MPPLNENTPKQPPPLPSQIQASLNSLFEQKAATLSVWAPMLALILTASLYGLVPSASEWAQKGKFLVLSFGGLLILTGLISAIVALRNNERGVFGRALAGLLINAALIALLVLGLPVVYAIKERVHKQKVMANVQESERQLQADTKKAFEAGTGTRSASDRLQKFQKSMENAAQDLKGDDALVLNASSAYLKQLQILTKQYTDAANPILHPSVLNMSEVKEKEDLDVKRKAVVKFLIANEEFKLFIMKGEAPLKEELEKLHVSERTAESCLRGFRGKQYLRTTVVKIRELDTRIGNTTLSMLDILDTNWGKWNYRSDKKNVLIEDHDALERYNAFCKELMAAGRSQAMLQKQLLKEQAE
ncbi:hypothetical protein [Pedosphaera parvula]|nr:hypothetical protein [Pedosphaera parvula]